MTLLDRARSLPTRFRAETHGSASVELVIVLPMLLWALAATAVFFDGFKARYHAQMAAQTVADIMSRETNLFTANYVEGLNNVYDFLADSRYPTRIRVSSVIWDSTNNRYRLQWSYGTRGLAPLPTDTFALMQSGDLASLRAEFGTASGFSFASAAAQMPVENLPSRIPPVLPGEALLLVESFALWSPFASVGVGRIRFDPVVVVRPRFAPWINFEGVAPINPETNYEIAWTGGGNTTLPNPNIPVPTPTPTPAMQSFSFDNGVTTGWSNSTITTGGPSGGFLGPFGRETYDRPVTLGVDFGQAVDSARIEFDLLILDRWNGWATGSNALPRGDTMTLMIDGTPISLEAFKKDAPDSYGLARASSVTVNGATYQVNMTPTQTGSSFYGSTANDQIWHVTIAATHPPAAFQLGFSAGINGSLSNESFGIDTLRITATGDGTGTTAAAIPNPAHATGADPYSRFPQFSGCPDESLPAPWLTMDATTLNRPITITRQARVGTDLGRCNTVPGHGYISASPQIVFNFTRQPPDTSNNRLLIRMDDHDNGYTCDTTLLVRDPNGQWWFNDDYNNWNAGLQFGTAQAGAYAIWIGSYNNRACSADITFQRY